MSPSVLPYRAEYYKIRTALINTAVYRTVISDATYTKLIEGIPPGIVAVLLAEIDDESLTTRGVRLSPLVSKYPAWKTVSDIYEAYMGVSEADDYTLSHIEIRDFPEYDRVVLTYVNNLGETFEAEGRAELGKGEELVRNFFHTEPRKD